MDGDTFWMSMITASEMKNYEKIVASELCKWQALAPAHKFAQYQTLQEHFVKYQYGDFVDQEDPYFKPTGVLLVYTSTKTSISLLETSLENHDHYENIFDNLQGRLDA